MISNLKIALTNQTKILLFSYFLVLILIDLIDCHSNKLYVSYIGISYNALFVRSNLVRGHFCHHSSPSKFIVSIFIISSGNSFNSKWTNAIFPVCHAFFIAATKALLFSKFDFLLLVVYTGTTKFAGPFYVSYCYY